MNISSNVYIFLCFRYANYMLISNYANIKFPEVAVVVTKLNFLQYTYRIRINHKNLYSQTFPCHI